MRAVHAPPPVVLALDLGSSGVKGAAFDTWGRSLAGLEVQESVALRYASGGVAEVPLNDVMTAAERVLDRLHSRLGNRAVLAVALTSIASTLVALNKRGEAVGPVLSYADTRSAGEVEALRGLTSPDETGCPAFSAYWPAQVRWWRLTHPELSVARFCSVPDFLLERWTGECVTSYSLASWTGLLDRRTLGWNARALAAAGLHASQLPVLGDHDTPLFLQRRWADRWPKLALAPFHPAVADGATANVGSGALTLSRPAVTVGSTSAVRFAVRGDPPPIPPGLWSYRIDRETHLLGGALTEGGNLYSWLQTTLRLGRELDQELLTLSPDAHGLTFLPALGGTRSPDYDPHARGTIHGLGYATTPVEIARAAMEGVACRLANVAWRLPVSGDALFVASGQALLASRAWQQILADALGRPLLLEDIRAGASARGAALMALQNQGHQVSTEPVAQRLVKPDPAHHDAYRALHVRMDCLTDQLRELRTLRERVG
ncbi:gluconokinase [Deinococcus hopiensis]|uniref:Gluconokinase n=1 Tax=Deinococcus hopiensis KR-140 TaxID=695939 RepID=A0A1W1UU86_9DEIO|nr:gluconokinase [Deinococcus hopiensis]SMB84718.1 gluconokinase [Deinococcus hopiensis KR-140]